MSVKHQQQRGAVLLIALLIIAGLTAIGLGVSVIIFNGLRSAALVDHSITATYASEAGLEWSLEKLAEGRADGLSLTAVMSPVNGIRSGQGSFATNGASWRTADSSDLTDELVADVATGNTVQLDLFNPLAETAVSGTEQIEVKAASGSGWAEVSWVAWDGQDFIPNSRTELINPTNLTSATVIDLVTIRDPELQALVTSGRQLLAFRVKVKARFGDLNDITIKALNGSGAKVNIPNRAFLKSNGKSGDATIALTASIPWRLPTSPLFDFVVFSEESIEK